MKYIENFELILEMAEQEAEKMTWLMVAVMNIPVIEKNSDGGFIDAHL